MNRFAGTGLWLLALAVAPACGDDDSAADDGGTDVDVVEAEVEAAADADADAPEAETEAEAGDIVPPPPPPGCPVGFDTDTGTLFYVDPAAGDDGNDGSRDHPWRSIQHVVSELVDCTDQHGTPLNPGAPVQAGDTIFLVGAEGHDQTLEITGCYNDDYVKIKALVLHEPRLSFVHFRGSAYWRIEGLTLFNDGGGTMLRAEDHDVRGETHHLQVMNNHFTSGELMTADEFQNMASTGVWLLGADHVVVQCNTFYKVGQAMTVPGEYIDILDNRVEFFARDGIATSGAHNRYLRNVFYDSVKQNDTDHDDFYQNHMGANPDTSTDLEIAYNVFQNRYSDALPMALQGPTQCLSAFEDGPKTDIRIYNNVCKTDHYHGITWADTNDSLIVNNTVVGGTELPGLPAGSEDWPDHTWISIEGTGNTVRNNLVTMNNAGGDHNLEVTGDDVYLYFTDWAARDLSLREGAPAIDAGSPDGAPADDVLGTARDATPDVGAYEYVP
ncbi:MAG: hypothetical protein JXB32_15260 [Deltaproteobacteria bacterium]|nr:hypothetical protein [Deltaproteobacteria bacterium]